MRIRKGRAPVMVLIAFLLLEVLAAAQTLVLPPRPDGAPTGSEFVRRIMNLDLEAREREVVFEIRSGNVPAFLRHLRPVQLRQVADGRTNSAVVYVTADYLALGSDADYFLSPLSPATAQRLADALGCSLPTRRIVDAIYAVSEVRLAPNPIPPSPSMTSAAVFADHNQQVWSQRRQQIMQHPLGALVAGHKKDVVLSPQLSQLPGKVAIYGWHQTNGTPIQPLYLGHAVSWVDYSQCVRLVSRRVIVNGETATVASVLSDPVLCGLLSDEGPFTDARYPSLKVTAAKALLPGFESQPQFQEQTFEFTVNPDIRVHINAPADLSPNTTKPVELILYALPNGNTIEQTIGKSPAPGDGWRYDIQHIGAQTRFLRACLTNRLLVVAYLESAMRSWPGWRKKHGDELIPGIVEKIRSVFPSETELVLTGHSGGGSFTFGYLNAMENIPENVRRIAFLDSTYAYDKAKGHGDKLARWLRRGASTPLHDVLTPADSGAQRRVRLGSEERDQHVLCVLAYDDANALLDGKPFVSAVGGTWGRSQAMLQDLSREFSFTSRRDLEFQRFSALNGRIQFILKENPDRKILHTIQVERNGFIHAMLTGTALEGSGYEYFAERSYQKWIAR